MSDPATAGPSHRERVRRQTLAEIRVHALAQIDEGGPTALSLKAIAKELGMSGPAMYRYFDSRDDLVAVIVAECYEELAAALETAARAARRRGAPGRLRAVADAFRAWGLERPNRYRLVFGSTYGSGALDPERIVPAAQTAMTVVLAALADVAPSPPPGVRDPALARQLAAWAARTPSQPAYATGVLQQGLIAWTQMHGLVSLEIEGALGQTGVDPGRLYAAQLDAILATT